jgi:hypothetical protein
VGVLLKPTVALVPLVLLVAWALQRRSWRALLEPHFAGMLAAAFAYALSLVTVFEGWLAVGRVGAEAYWAYAVPWPRVLRAAAPDLLHALVPFALVAATTRDGRLRGFLLPLAACAMAFQLSMLLQGKAFVYHALPGRQLASIACAIALAGWMGAGRRRAPSLFVIGLAMAGFLYGPFGGALLVGFPRPVSVVAGLGDAATRRTPLFRHLERAAAYGPLVVLSTSLLPAWPSVAMVGAEWASRGPCDWIAPAVLQLEEEGEGGRVRAAPLRELGARILAEDLERWKPPVVVLRSDAPTSPRSPGNLVAFYGDDARVAAQWKAYRFEKDDENWQYWVRLGSAADRPRALDD